MSDFIPSLEIIEPADIEAALEAERANKGFRPTTVLIATTMDGQIPFVQSAKSPEALFWPVQGGIDLGETPAQAGVRETGEELPGVERFNVHPLPKPLLGALRSPKKPEAACREEYEEGKLLIAFGARILLESPHIGEHPGSSLEEIRARKLLDVDAAQAELERNSEVAGNELKALFLQQMLRRYVSQAA